jgi:hypothetical protein
MGYDLCGSLGGGGGVVSGSISAVSGTVLFSDVGTKAIGVALPAGATVTRVEVNVTMLFDGTTPTLTVGDAAQHDRLMLAGENDLGQVALNIADVVYKYAAATQINAYLTIGGVPSQGSALIIVQYINL